MTKVTNLETAVSIVRTSTDKATALADIMNILGVSRSNAFVYHTKASKILFSANNLDEIEVQTYAQEREALYNHSPSTT